MNELWAFFLSQLQTNQFLTGATLTGLLAGVVYTIKGWLLQGYAFTKRFFTVSLTIHSEDPLFLPVSSWLYKHNFDKLARNYRVRYVEGNATYGPAEGTFLFTHGGRFIEVSISKDQAQQGSSWRTQTKEYLTVSYYSFKRSRHILDEIINDALMDYVKADEGVPVYTNGHSGCTFITRVPRRKTPSIVLAGDSLEQIEADIARFVERKDWYLDRGVPYHRGYLLTGPPGTGKTSLVRHLAQKFGMAVYVSDGSIKSITSVPPKSILLLEDVDSIAKMRMAAKAFDSTTSGTAPTAQSVPMSSAELDNLFAPTLSELLNALDGLASANEIIVIMTTNHPELLDAAVLRPGRVDYRLHLGPATVEQAARMFAKFYGLAYAKRFKAIVQDGEYTPAQLQEIFIISQDAEEAIRILETRVDKAA